MSDKIIPFPTVNKAVEAINNEAKQQKNMFEEVAKSIQDINPALGGFEELAAMLALPDEEFMVIGPIFLNELEKSFNNANDKMLMVQAMNASGMKCEDLQKEYLEINQMIDQQMTMLSRSKRDFLKSLMGMTYNAIAETEGIAKRILQIPIELCHPDAKMPAYANLNDSGMDVYAVEDVTIHPGETVLVKTGIKMAIPKGYEIQVRPKSGRALKTKMRVANTPGTIDSGYRDEIGVIIDNIEPPIKDIDYEFDASGRPVITSILHGSDYTIGKGEKFAQLVLCEVPRAALYEVESVSAIENDGRKGGFGSTGLK